MNPEEIPAVGSDSSAAESPAVPAEAASTASSEAAAADSSVTATSDYSEELQMITEKMIIMDQRMEAVESAAGTVLTYGVFYIPLIILVLSLWWFFRNFLNRYY